jgi:signal transduction histidine kinase/HD-like signal output (HDOD) protein
MDRPAHHPAALTPQAAQAAPAPTTPAPTDRARHLDTILGRIDALPTLSPVAARLLALSSADDADFSEIIKLIESDPALTGRLLALCKRANRATTAPVTTVRKAVVLLGLEALQAAVLSVHVFDLLGGAPGAEETAEPPSKNDPIDPARFDRRGFWEHSVAVASCAELLAEAHKPLRVRPDEAFTAGLVHDLGKVVLDWILPKTYARCTALAAQRQCSLAEVERRLIGADHHTVGKRLAERWGLPHAFLDAIWLHGQPKVALPEVPHKNLIAVVSAADALCRGLHLGWSGNHESAPALATIAEDAGLDAALVEPLLPRLHQAVAERCADLGLADLTPPDLMLRSIAAANARLGALNRSLAERSALAARQTRAVVALEDFLSIARPASTVPETLEQIVRSFADCTATPAAPPAASTPEAQRPGFFATLYQAREGDPWHLARHQRDGTTLHAVDLDPPLDPDHRPLALATLAPAAASPGAGFADVIALANLLTEHLASSDDGLPTPDLRRLRFLPLLSPSGPAGLLIHDHEAPLPDTAPAGAAAQPPARSAADAAWRALVGAWAFSLGAAAQHQGARRLGEALALSNRTLSEAQAQRAQADALARLAEVTAGAAHEMNNPLTIISGKAQMLTARLKDERDRADAATLAAAAGRLSDLISRLHLFAKPPALNLRPTNVPEVIAAAVTEARSRPGVKERLAGGEHLRVPKPIPQAALDPALMTIVIAEVVRNAMDAAPNAAVEITARVEELDDRLLIEVRDRGPGLSDHALHHAFDPFFSEKAAGRQAGLGLAIARRLVGLHGGDIILRTVQAPAAAVPPDGPGGHPGAPAAQPGATGTGAGTAGNGAGQSGTVVVIALPRWRWEAQGTPARAKAA